MWFEWKSGRPRRSGAIGGGTIARHRSRNGPRKHMGGTRAANPCDNAKVVATSVSLTLASMNVAPGAKRRRRPACARARSLCNASDISPPTWTSALCEGHEKECNFTQHIVFVLPPRRGTKMSSSVSARMLNILRPPHPPPPGPEFGRCRPELVNIVWAPGGLRICPGPNSWTGRKGWLSLGVCILPVRAVFRAYHSKRGRSKGQLALFPSDRCAPARA